MLSQNRISLTLATLFAGFSVVITLPAFAQMSSPSPAHPAPDMTAPLHDTGNKGMDADGDQDKAYPPQSSVAAKTAKFAFVAASSPLVAKALDAMKKDDAQKLIGKMGAFQGTVSKAYSPRDNDIVILDFAPNYHDALTAVVKPALYAKFPNLQTLVGKHVLVSGKFEAFHNSPQLDLTSPAQVKIIR